MEEKAIIKQGERERYLKQSEVLRTYPISYFQLKKLRDEKIIKTYRVLVSERDVYYDPKELDLILYRMFRSDEKE